MIGPEKIGRQLYTRYGISISTRLEGCLIGSNLDTPEKVFEAVSTWPRDKWMKIPNFGKVTYAELVEAFGQSERPVCPVCKRELPRDPNGGRDAELGTNPAPEKPLEALSDAELETRRQLAEARMIAARNEEGECRFHQLIRRHLRTQVLEDRIAELRDELAELRAEDHDRV